MPDRNLSTVFMGYQRRALRSAMHLKHLYFTPAQLFRSPPRASTNAWMAIMLPRLAPRLGCERDSQTQTDGQVPAV